jgi:putative FmdB family regulatory protein
MPHYDYQCSSCQHTLEAFQKITDAPLTTCPKCQTPHLQRGPGGGIGLAFKGSGFYITDYAPAQKTPDESTQFSS